MAAETRLAPSPAAAPARIEAAVVLVDIEGTISPVSFVRDVLFPYSRERLAAFVDENRSSAEVQDILDQAQKLSGNPHPLAALAEWQANDVKAPPLKKLQGLIWESGYRSGAFQSPIYADALIALKQWRAEGAKIYVYSSGSLQAQQLFFEFNRAGDLRPLFAGYFDTDAGSKIEAASYNHIAQRIGTPPNSIVFLSDALSEVAAARSSGLQTVLVVRDSTPSGRYSPEISEFSELTIVSTGTI